MTTVYSYLRFSRPEQMKGDSRRRQIEKTRRWAEENGHQIDESLSLEDLGVSAYLGKNASDGALRGFRDAIKTGKVKRGDILVLENLDRLSRAAVLSVALPLVQEIVSAGVAIVTLDPEQRYDEDSLQELGPLIKMLIEFCTANEESRKKSIRLSDAWKEKRSTAEKVKLTEIAPGWMKLADDRSRFELVPERAKIIRRIFQMTADGAGLRTIVKALNAEETPTFGWGKRTARFWQPSYITKILANRATIGEFHPHRMVDGKRVPAGDPIPNYFPPVVDEKTFYAAQQAKSQRKGGGGRVGQKVTNLFPQLVRDARDGSPMNVINKGDGPSLVSSGARFGQAGSVYISFPYAPFEQALVLWGHDLQLEDVVPGKGQDLTRDLTALEGEKADLEFRITKLDQRLRTDPNMDRLLDTISRWNQELVQLQQQIEHCQREQSNPVSEAAASLKELIGLLKTAQGQSLIDLRLKLRQHLGRIVQDIVVLVVQVNFERLAIVDILLTNGNRRQLAISPPGTRVRTPEELVGRDIRTWNDWPEGLRATQFTGMTDDESLILKAFDEGRPRGDLAPLLNVSPKLVTRTLLKYGRVEERRKKVYLDRLMTWSNSPRGWIKRHQKVRYFVGLGTLASEYPKLFQDKSAEGSREAANAWWEAQQAKLPG